ncbi:metal ABC transporter permease [Trueperella pyogenes]|uniref:metal ABC transporter permease n=1 Tax=Trueperella pyogenes TaxID=1661 RepID=UPI003DA829FE
MSFIVAVMLLTVTTAVACALPGTFLVLRGQSMLVDGLSHAVLPGIVIGAIISGSAHSPLMTIIATLCGLVVVIGADKLKRTGLLTGDANQGVIFPSSLCFGSAASIYESRWRPHLREHGSCGRPQPDGFGDRAPGLGWPGFLVRG